nr:hypothetical protein [Microbacterium barkeri]
MTETTIPVVSATEDKIIDPVPLSEAAGLLRRNEFSGRRDIRTLRHTGERRSERPTGFEQDAPEKGLLVDRRVPGDLVGVPARRLGQHWFVNRADLNALDGRRRSVASEAPANAGLSRELGLIVYTGYAEDTWVAVGNVWPLVTLAAAKPDVCAVDFIADADGAQVPFRVEVTVFDRVRFARELGASTC